MPLTTAEVASYLGISPAGVRKLVQRRRLRPVLGSKHPLKFRWDDVERVRANRMTAAEHAHLDALADLWRASS